MYDKTDDWDRRHPDPPAMSDKERSAAEDMRERAAREVERLAAGVRDWGSLFSKIDQNIGPEIERRLTMLEETAAAIRSLKVGE